MVIYNNVDDESVDEAAKQVVEVINNTSSTMLEKGTKEDIVGVQAYTIRNLDNKLLTESDIDQHKVKNVQEDPLDNRQSISMLCAFQFSFQLDNLVNIIPVRLNSLTVSMSNLDYSRFRKDPQYVFYLLWQKEMCLQCTI